jgi:hypothetical protein
MSEEIIDGEVITESSLAKYDEPVRHLSLNEISDIASVFVKSGLFKDTADQAKAMVKIMAGNELGVSPFASMRGFDIIQGKLAPGAALTGALIKRNTNPYDYRVIENTDTVCKIEFYKGGQLIGTTVFTMEDATRAQLTGKDNWRKFPRQMLLARALSEGARNHCPDVFMGAIYSPDELESVDAPPQQVSAQSAQPKPATNNDVNADIKTLWDKAAQYRGASQDGAMPPDKLKAFILNLARALKNAGQFSANDKQRKLLVMLLSEMFGGDDTMRHIFTKHIFGAESTKELEGAQVNAFLAWMEISQEQDGRYIPSESAMTEAELAINYAMQAAQDEAQSVSAEEYENKGAE